jgi:hypothetical protein
MHFSASEEYTGNSIIRRKDLKGPWGIMWVHLIDFLESSMSLV